MVNIKTGYMKDLLLSEQEVEKIHLTSVDILEKVGIKLLHDDLFEFVSNFDGIKIDIENRIVKFSPYIIKNSVNRAGKSFKIFGRNKNRSADFGYGKVVTSSSWGMPFKIDTTHNRKLPASADDLRKSAVICDYLDNIDITGVMFRPNEIPQYYRDIYEYGEAVKRTDKPVGLYITSLNTFKYILEIYKLFLKDENEIAKFPPFFYEFENISPLIFQHDGVDILYMCAKLGIPISNAPIPQPMTTGPVTIAGCLALGNAEILASIVLTQLINPGLPFLYGLMCNVPDPFTLIATFTGAPENVLLSIGQSQLARYYGFPVFLDNQITCSNQIDYQMGAEFGINSLIGLMLNADMYGHIGIVGPDQGASIEKLILDDETLSYIKRIRSFFEVTKETLALDVIKKVGIGGNFLLEDHTLKYMRSEYWTPKLFNRDSYTGWQEKGKNTLISKATDRKNFILKNHQPQLVSKDIENEIDKIVNKAKQCLQVS
jgi:trimethylamine--corrinoid protein Co-methyltransferase